MSVTVVFLFAFHIQSLYSGCIPNGLCLDERYVAAGSVYSTQYVCNEDESTSEIRYEGVGCNETNENSVIGTYGDDSDLELGMIECDGSCNGYVKWREYKPKYAPCDSYGGYSEFAAPIGCISFEEDESSVNWFCEDGLYGERERLSFGYDVYNNVNCQGNATRTVTYRGGKCSTGYGTSSYSYMDLEYCGKDWSSGNPLISVLSYVITVILIFAAM